VEEAKAKGIDVEHAKPVDARDDTTSPVGTKPPAAAVADLEEKIQELKLENPAKPTFNNAGESASSHLHRYSH
jgi:hypothetical protein